MPATELQRQYYLLPENATFRDVILAVRADETIHRDVNHKFAKMAKDGNADEELAKFLLNDPRIHNPAP